MKICFGGQGSLSLLLNPDSICLWSLKVKTVNANGKIKKRFTKPCLLEFNKHLKIYSSKIASGKALAFHFSCNERYKCKYVSGLWEVNFFCPLWIQR